MGKSASNEKVYEWQVERMMKYLRTSCAFTGHRPKKFPWRNNEDDPACAALQEVIKNEITRLTQHGIKHFLSGMAEGTDSWCALTVLSLRENNPALQLHCLIPHRGQADQWAKNSKERYRDILDRADSIWYVNREKTNNCMMDRNHALIDFSSIVLAVYNGEPRGGTAATVRYARKMGRSIILINPLTLEVTYENYRLLPTKA